MKKLIEITTIGGTANSGKSSRAVEMALRELPGSVVYVSNAMDKENFASLKQHTMAEYGIICAPIKYITMGTNVALNKSTVDSLVRAVAHECVPTVVLDFECTPQADVDQLSAKLISDTGVRKIIITRSMIRGDSEHYNEINAVDV